MFFNNLVWWVPRGGAAAHNGPYVASEQHFHVANTALAKLSSRLSVSVAWEVNAANNLHKTHRFGEWLAVVHTEAVACSTGEAACILVEAKVQELHLALV